MFRAHVLIIRKSRLHYTASGIITPIGGLLVHRLREDYRCDDTRGCVMQFWPPDDEHMCSKHVGAWNNFDVLLTVHLSIIISVINQLDAQNFCFTISLFHASTCFEHMCSSSGDLDCRGCVMQFWPPNDEHMCSKHAEEWNKVIIKQKFCASSWLIT